MLLNVVYRTISAPSSKVCKHLLALSILDRLEILGFTLDEDLVDSVVESRDKDSLAMLEFCIVRYKEDEKVSLLSYDQKERLLRSAFYLTLRYHPRYGEFANLVRNGGLLGDINCS